MIGDMSFGQIFVSCLASGLGFGVSTLIFAIIIAIIKGE